MDKLAVIAFGGNALLRGDQKGTIDEQEANVYETCTYLVPLIKQGYNFVIGHGNGPQVGNVILQHQAGEKMFGIPAQPIDFCVAETQGSIGYMIEQQLRNVLIEEHLERDILTIITEVIVDKDDPAFHNPTKPVGPFYSKEEADKIAAETSAKFHEDPRGRGWRKVVASPMPLQINNVKSIEKLARDGQIIIAVGGGGIPVFWVHSNKLQGIDAVIDKDLASSLLAVEIKADIFIILTDIPKVYINFHKPDEKALDRMSITEARRCLSDNQFSEGSMAPKVRACIKFVEKSGKEALITMASELGKPGAGTIIYAE
ncbi:MAG: carbamate kinase [Bacteroidales bacterium]|nr:carbamate kinase [Bacteroidales bacterium]MBP9512284.1 carbamate kinase [Bacteroidales bacterium]MDI9574002.1 carbamate kinase [Bacteroidota bacterium]